MEKDAPRPDYPRTPPAGRQHGGISVAQYLEVHRRMDRRMGQHRNDMRRCDERNSIFKHVSTKNHNVLISDCNIISRINNVHTRKLVESFLIKNTEKMNSYEVSVKIDNVTSELLKKNVKSLNALLNKLENG